MGAKALLFAVLGCALLRVNHAAAEKPIVIESNENGDIALTQPTRVGGLTLQPDTYAVQHHDSDGQHFIRFMRVKESRELRVTRAFTGWYTDRQLIKAGEVKCRVRPLAAKARATAVTVASDNGTQRIMQLTIRGKKAVYVFQVEANRNTGNLSH